MRLFNDFLLYSALSTSVFHASLTHATPAAPSKAGGVFATIPTPQKGNCDGYDVDTMISDAKTLAQNSIDAINTLSGGGFLGLTYSESTHTLAQTAYVNWGVTYTTLIPGRIKIRSGLDTMSTAKGFYQKVLDILNGGSTPTGQANLMCTDAGFTYVTTNKDIGKTPPDDPIYADAPGGSVSYYFGQLVPDIAYDSSGTMGVNMCSPYNPKGQALTRAGGITWADAGLIMMCGSEFNGQTLASRIASQGSLPVGTTLDSLQIAGASFLHEMMHFLRQSITDYQLSYDGNTYAAYGVQWTIAMALDETYAKYVTLNADNYRNFAMSVSLNQIDWTNEGKKQS